MFIGYQNGKIVAYAETREELENPFVTYDSIEETTEEIVDIDGVLYKACDVSCECCKVEAVETLKQNRDAQLSIPFTYNGFDFQIDSNSTDEIDKWERCLDETTVPTTWLDVDNVSRTFDTVADFTAFKNSCIKEAKKVWDAYNSKRTAITNASTKEEVEQVDLTIDVR